MNGEINKFPHFLKFYTWQRLMSYFPFAALRNLECLLDKDLHQTCWKGKRRGTFSSFPTFPEEAQHAPKHVKCFEPVSKVFLISNETILKL